MSDYSKQNGLNERINDILLTRARVQLIVVELPATLWAEAFRTIIYVINRSLTSALDKTSHETLYKVKSNLSRMHPFGLICYAHDYKAKQREKISPKGFRCVFLDYERINQYRLWDVKNHKLLRRRDVIWGQLEPFASPLDVSIENWDDVSNKENEDVVTIPLPRNLNSYFEDVLEASQGFIEEISENKNLQDSEVDSITELSSAEAI